MFNSKCRVESNTCRSPAVHTRPAIDEGGQRCEPAIQVRQSRASRRPPDCPATAVTRWRSQMASACVEWKYVAMHDIRSLSELTGHVSPTQRQTPAVGDSASGPSYMYSLKFRAPTLKVSECAVVRLATAAGTEGWTDQKVGPEVAPNILFRASLGPSIHDRLSAVPKSDQPFTLFVDIPKIPKDRTTYELHTAPTDRPIMTSVNNDPLTFPVALLPITANPNTPIQGNGTPFMNHNADIVRKPRKFRRRDDHDVRSTFRGHKGQGSGGKLWWPRQRCLSKRCPRERLKKGR